MFKTHTSWEFLVVQWLGLYISPAGATGSILFRNLNPTCHRVLPKKKKKKTHLRAT